jgi:8-oxo-dGTP pyrophosphatase MutT (NUDIX family)
MPVMSKWIREASAGKLEPTGAEAKPAATVVVLRDGPGGLEVLMGRRSSKMNFHGGAWVFPGGRVDDADWAGAADELEAAQRAAVREAHEEAGVIVVHESLVHVSNWTTPDISPKRFATWFFAGALAAHSNEAVADGVESDALRWFTPAEALEARLAGEIDLAPPQFVTLHGLHAYESADAALAGIAAAETVDFRPRIHFGDGFAIAIYGGDVAYDDPDRVDEPGPRHRLTMPGAGPWDYEDTRA